MKKKMENLNAAINPRTLLFGIRIEIGDEWVFHSNDKIKFIYHNQ